jgi:hypothetical protein
VVREAGRGRKDRPPGPQDEQGGGVHLDWRPLPPDRAYCTDRAHCTRPTRRLSKAGAQTPRTTTRYVEDATQMEPKWRRTRAGISACSACAVTLPTRQPT